MARTGFLDSVDTGCIRGWAYDDQNPNSPAIVDICINGDIVATIGCSEFRQDLLDAHIGDGCHGFSYGLPQLDGDLTVRFAGGGPVLHNGVCVLPGLSYRLLVSSVLARGLWSIDNLSVSETGLALDGWCVPPRAIPVPFEIAHNGAKLALTRHPRDDIARMIGLVRDETGFGFRAQSPLSGASGAHEFSFQHAGSRRPFDPHQTIHYLERAAPLPPAVLRKRVHGAEDAASFIREGSTVFVRLERVLEEYFSKSITGFGHMLDWGCGSGRVLRYFAGSGARSVTGMDIDPQAIAWCRQTFPLGEFIAAKPQPPAPVAAATFDLIYGISVLTHLGEDDQIKWLREPQRIAKPNAIILLTTFGDIAWWRGRLPWNRYSTWRTDNSGFYNAGPSKDLDETGVADPGYYCNVFVSHEFILRNWSRYFEIVDILPGAIGNLQDLIILRRGKP